MKKSIARPYIRSEAPRQRWSTDLHRYFVQVVEQLGGERKAKPKKILELMGVRRLELSHVKSHLQMYRNKKKEESKQEETIAWQRRWWQYEQYLRIYGYIRDNTRLYSNIDEKIAAFTKATKEVSCESLFQSSRIGPNEIGGNEGALKEEVSEGEEELSLELSLGLKF